MLTGEFRWYYFTSSRFNLTILNSDSEQEAKTNQEEDVLIWNEPTPTAQDEADANLQTPRNVPYMRLIAPVADAALQGNSKRPRMSPAVLYPEPEVVTKPATSIPAMIIPHLVSHRTAISPRSMVFHD